MSQTITDMLQASEGRYLNTAEKAALREFTRGLEERLAAMEEIAAKESILVENAVREVIAAYPDLEKRYKNPMQSCVRDVTLVVRYVTQAMVRSDPQYLNDGLLIWLATILRGVGFVPQFIEDTYKILGLSASRELSPAAAKLFQPFWAQCASVLSGRHSAPAAKAV